MSGIVGIIGKFGTKEIISKMTRSMKHEDFYSLDTFSDKKVALGVTSFSNTFVFNEKKTLLELVSGEIFGQGLSSCLRLYEQEGMNFLSKIKGEFAVVIYDIKKGKLFLASDRYGFKPLYYTELSDKFIFASEIKAILEYPEVKREVDSKGLAEYALFNYPLGENTLVKNIKRFPSGEIFEFDVETTSELRLHKRKYWKFNSLLEGKKISTRESLEQGGKVFHKIVKNLINSEGIYPKPKGENEVGITLSAGYDSRVILSTCRNEVTSPLQIRALTFGKDTNKEVVAAKKLAKIVGCTHLVQEFGKDFDNGIMDFLYRTVWITDGLCNITHSGLLYIFKKHREFMNPCFAGFGGSEIIRGLQDTGLTFSQNSKKFLLSNEQQLATDIQYNGFFSLELCKNRNNSQFTTYGSQLTTHELALSFLLNEVIRKYYGASIALMSSQVQVRLPYIDYDFLKFILRTPFSILHTASFSRNPFERLKGQKFSASIIKYNDSRLLEVPTDRGYSPSWNLSNFGLPVIFWHQIRRRLVGTSHKASLLRLSVKQILEESQTLRRNYYNLDKLKKAIKQYPNWNLEEWQELSKIATFEIWLRQFMD